MGCTTSARLLRPPLYACAWLLTVTIEQIARIASAIKLRFQGVPVDLRQVRESCDWDERTRRKDDRP